MADANQEASALIERALDRLPTDEALALSAALEAPSRARQRRLDARDALIRDALAGTEGATLTARACAFERRMRRAMRSAVAADELASRALALNGGKPLGWQHLSRIARSGRNPDLCRNSDGTAQPVWAG